MNVYPEKNREIIEKSRKGDLRAQYSLYNQYAKAMLNVSYRLMGTIESAEDILQDSFTEAFRMLHTYRFDSSINTSASIYFKKDRDYTIKIISEDKTDISYSAGLGEFTTQKLEGKEKRMQAECLYGIKNQAVPVSINVKSGLLTLKLKE